MEPEFKISQKGAWFLQGRNTSLALMCQSRKEKFGIHLTVARLTPRDLLENTDQSMALQVFTIFLQDFL